MNQFNEKEVLQAILIADNNVDDLRPLSDDCSTALLPLVNVAMIDYALEALNRNGIEEVFVYSSLHLKSVREHIRQGIDHGYSWSINMHVRVIGGEGSRCFGDAMRDLDDKALIRSNFIVLGADTITNANLKLIFEQHKKSLKYDKGAVATLVFKEARATLRTGNEVMIAFDAQNMRLYHHQRLRINAKERDFSIPLEVFTNNSQISLSNLLDPQIAIGSPSMLSLFNDNFDFQTCDDFIHGVLINEELLNSRIYLSLLTEKEYARKVNNWLSYQIVSQDVINRWAFPLVPEMSIECYAQQYSFLRNNIYKSPEANSIKAIMRENVVVHAGTSIGANSVVSNSVIGKNCEIGVSCRLNHAYLMDNVIIEDNCELDFCVIASGCVIGANSVLSGGTVIGENSFIPAKSELTGSLIKSQPSNEDEVKLCENAYIIKNELENDNNSVYSDDEDDNLPPVRGLTRMTKLPMTFEESDYDSMTSDEEESCRMSPAIDDTKIFLSEVIDSLTRGFQEKSNPDFLILEINSSRYAYNMSLQEVNFNVIKAIFSLESIKKSQSNSILGAVNLTLKHLGPIISNYIKNEDAMLDCLSALEDIYDENEHVREKFSQILHYLYDKDFVSENAILCWYSQLHDNRKTSYGEKLRKLIEWLNQSSDEDESDD